jgi:hypothetical protein
MTWHKKVDVMGPSDWSISVSTTDGVDGILVNVVSPAGYVHLTPNQAGGLAHALQEAIQHAQEVK